MGPTATALTLWYHQISTSRLCSVSPIRPHVCHYSVVYKVRIAGIGRQDIHQYRSMPVNEESFNDRQLPSKH